MSADSENRVGSIKLRLTGRQHARLVEAVAASASNAWIAAGICGAAERTFTAESNIVLTLHRLDPLSFSDPDDDESMNLPCLFLADWSAFVPLFLRYDAGVMLPSGSAESLRKKAKYAVPTWNGVGSFTVAHIRGDGSMSAVFVDAENHQRVVGLVTVTGSDLLIWHSDHSKDVSEQDELMRFDQAFGRKTRRLLSQLHIAVVGASGTGSSVAAMIHRLGVREITLVDKDVMESVNTDRIYFSSPQDAEEQRPKVDVVADGILMCSPSTVIHRLHAELHDRRTVRHLSHCDVVFGCLDSHSGRSVLNTICTYYSIPYFDLGVHITADGKGGVDGVCGTVHYLRPDGSSLFSRHVVDSERVAAEDLKRIDPTSYQNQLNEGYIRGINENNPAVISLNTHIASLAVNELLARLHPFRREPNEYIESVTVDLCETRMVFEPEGPPCPYLSALAGKGDVEPLLGMPELSQSQEAQL